MNTNLTEILVPESISLDLKGKTKQEIIEELIYLAGLSGQVSDNDAACSAVIARERKSSTGLEMGVAVPHGKTEAVDKLVAAFGIKRAGINFDAADHLATRLFFLLLSPTTTSGPHVTALARVAKILLNANIQASVLNAPDAATVLQIFNEAQSK